MEGPASSGLRVSIVVIGDEILAGYVQDTNSGWLAQRLCALGVPLDRIVTVPDDLHAIGDAVGNELARNRPRLVLTSGGIGSTPDDCTVEAIARHLGRDLVREGEIDRRISRALEWTADQGVTVTADQERSMRKMALVPEGAYLLSSEDGGLTPGIALDVDGGCDGLDGATMVILPGIPAELRRIMTDAVEPVLLAGRGEPAHVVELTHGYPESLVNPALDRLVREYPDVHVGSYPGLECVVRLTGARERVEAAQEVVRSFLNELSAHPASETMRGAWRRRWEEHG